MAETQSALAPFPDDVKVHKLEHDGFGLFIIKVPNETTPAVFGRICDVWNESWRNAGYANVPAMVVVDEHFKIEKASDRDLQAVGLMRIPTGLTDPG